MRLRQSALPCVLAVLLCACGAQPPPQPAAPSGSAGAEATAQLGDASVHASVVQTSTLDAGVARRYGIAREPGTILLLVAVRTPGGPAPDTLRLSAAATDLRGSRQAVPLRRLQVDGLTDYVGTVATTLPETLTFEVRATRGDGASASLQLSRDFYPE